MTETEGEMPRPQRCRRVCKEPDFLCFRPDEVEGVVNINLSVDEYETIRLVDYEKLSHEQCAAIMDISRTTVTEIYERARYKMADCLIHGKRLIISGGNYRICQEKPEQCCKRFCKRSKDDTDKIICAKGEQIMKVAVTYENEEIFQHFGHTEQFKVYDIENNQIVKSEVISSNGSGHGALAEILSNTGIDTLICGGIGGGAQTALAEAGIKLYGGVSGKADDAVNALLNGTLGYDPDVHCNHHSHEEGHSCGEYGCESDRCN